MKKEQIIIAVLISASILFSFWWFSYRPQEIKQFCYDDNKVFVSDPRWENLYKRCLLEKGIE
jgi:hypothetical protein